MKLIKLAVLVILLVARPGFAAYPPADVIDLKAWKLTLPFNTDRQGNPDEVVQPELSGFEDPACFCVAKDGAVLFRAPCSGQQTENSKYPRCELREMKQDEPDEAHWSTKDGAVHSLEAVLAITQTPRKKQHVVCLQIHDAKQDLLMVRLEGQKLLAERTGASDLLLASDYKIGTKLRLRIEASKGRIKLWLDGRERMDWPKKASGCYFKVGCYPQSNAKKEGGADSYGEVALYKLSLSHR